MGGGGLLDELSGTDSRSHSTPPRLPPVRKDGGSPPSKPKMFAVPSSVHPGGYPTRAIPPRTEAAAPLQPPAPPQPVLPKPLEQMTSDELLAFSRKPRDVDFKPKRTALPKAETYQMLGGLGPDLQNEALQEKVGLRCDFCFICL